MNIAFVNNRYQLGGAETVMQQLWRGATRRGHAARIFLGEAGEPGLPAQAEDLFPRWRQRLLHSRLHGLTRHFIHPRAETDRALVALGRGRHDVVHVHNFHGLYASIGALAGLAARAPVVWTFHRFWGATGGCDHPGGCARYLTGCGECPRVDEWPICGVDNTASQFAEKSRLLRPAALTIVAPSQHLARMVRGSPLGERWRVEVIPNGIDAAEFAPADPARRADRAVFGLSPWKTVVAVVNRSFTDPLKGGDILARAVARLDFSRAQVALVGGGAEPLLRSLPPGADVVSLGYVRSRVRLAALLKTSDLFLYASPRENFPCATLEAMAAGCCVVSTPTDGVLEQIEDGTDGLLAGDFTAENLAWSANRAIADPGLVRTMGAAARARAIRDFGEDRMVDRHLALYAETIAARRERQRRHAP